MKFLHLSDFHLGKKLNGFSMLRDQEHILKEVIKIIDEEKPEAVLIAGDIYDKPVPPAEAVSLLDNFLYELASRMLRVFIISGNHDSAERLFFGARLMNGGGVYIAPAYNGTVEPVVLNDAFGELAIYMLPFIKPVNVRRYYEDENIESYDDAVRKVVEHMNIDKSKRNILLSHQFVTGALRSDSEEIHVGGSDNISSEIYAPFDYAALGHIHRAQHVGKEHIRYCGTPLKYSFSEINHIKSASLVELREKGRIQIRERELLPLHDMRELKGSYMELTARGFYKDFNTEDYFRIILTDEEDVPDAVGRLRTVYPNLMQIDYDNSRTRREQSIEDIDRAENLSPMELFEQFFEKQNNRKMSEEQVLYMENLISKVWEEER
ncbi:MAG: exonuclease SbcCD subunit D [Anaerovoracaceae bacterium]